MNFFTGLYDLSGFFTDIVLDKSSLTKRWREAAADVKILHYDPAVVVSVSVYEIALPGGGTGAHVIISLSGVRDTDLLSGREKKKPFAGVLSISMKTVEWPGAELARRAVVGMWLLYVQHEALELTSCPGVMHPHDTESPKQLRAQDMIERLYHEIADDGMIRALAGLVVLGP